MAHELYLTLIVLATVVYATARALLDAADDGTSRNVYLTLPHTVHPVHHPPLSAIVDCTPLLR